MKRNPNGFRTMGAYVSPVLVGGSGLKPAQLGQRVQDDVVSPVLVGGSGLKPLPPGRASRASRFSRPGGREWIETA